MGLLLALVMVLPGAAQAADVYDGEVLDVDFGGDIKTFFLATVPYDHVLFLTPPYDPEVFDDPEPEVDPTGQGIADFRLKLDMRGGPFKFQLHNAITGVAPNAAGGAANAGVGQSTAQAVDLTWNEVDGEGLRVQSRVDRMSLAWRGSHADVTLGRQPISFGKALIFTPMDLVNPFNPAFIDQEYKPGVDALRADVYAGMATQITVAAAYAGDWDLPGMILAGYGQTTLGVWDLGLFAGSVREDLVGGVATAGSLGPVGLRGEVTWTEPADDAEDAFARAVVGGDWRPGEKTTLSGEVYVQTLGTTDPSEYLSTLSGDRYARGELWLAGKYYAGLSVSQEITPTVFGAMALIGNLSDPSAFAAPTIAWSVAGNTDFAAGCYFALGQRPNGISLENLLTAGLTEDAILSAIPVTTEFGLTPTTVFLQLKSYF